MENGGWGIGIEDGIVTMRRWKENVLVSVSVLYVGLPLLLSNNVFDVGRWGHFPWGMH